MRRHVLPGAALAVAGGLLVLLGGWLGLEIDSVVLLGAALGGALALVPDRGPAAKVTGFVAGFVIAWGGYAVRALALPDVTAGRAVAVVVVLVACLLVAWVTAGRLPLWSLLLGTAAMVGAYEATYVASPTLMATTSPTAATSVLLAAAFGFVAAAALGESVRRERAEQAHDEQATDLADEVLGRGDRARVGRQDARGVEDENVGAQR